MSRWKLRTITDDVLKEACAKSNSFRQVALLLDVKGGGSFAELKRRIIDCNIDVSHFSGQTWNKNLTKDDPRVARNAESVSRAMMGKSHPQTFETRQKLSRSASGKSFGNNARVKWHEVINARTGDSVKVQGTWEKRYAEWLNAQGVEWQRPKTTFSWRRDDSDIEHTYHPDFYLPATDTYVDIKGFMWKDDRKKIDDSAKLLLVQQQNPNLRLQVLMKNELRELGVL
jgi:hypothetical protein